MKNSFLFLPSWLVSAALLVGAAFLAGTAFPPAEPGPASLQLTIKVTKDNGDPFSTSVDHQVPTVLFCEWDSDADVEVDGFGNFQTNICEGLSPIRFTVLHDDYELINSPAYLAAPTTCESASGRQYYIPSLYFQQENNIIFKSCVIRDLVLRMRPKSVVENEADAIARATANGYSNLHNGGGGEDDGHGPAAGAAPADVHYLPQEQDRNRQNLIEWADEYSRLDERELAPLFLEPLQAYKRGALVEAKDKIERMNLPDLMLRARSFEEKRTLENTARLAARIYTLMGRPDRARYYFELASDVAPYQTPVLLEYVDYLEFRKDFTHAQPLLEKAVVRAAFTEDKALLAQNLGRVATFRGDLPVANIAAAASLNLRQDLQQMYLAENVGNQRLKESNAVQMVDLKQILTTPEVDVKKASWETLRLRNKRAIEPKEKRPGPEEDTRTKKEFRAVKSAGLPYLPDESGQVTRSGVVRLGAAYPPQAGDYRNNDPVRGFLRFDISGLPAGARISSALLYLPGATTGGGQVLGPFGELVFEALPARGSLTPALYDANPYAVAWRSERELPTQFDITKVLQEALVRGETRLLLRFRWSLDTDRDNNSDIYWIPVHLPGNTPAIEVRYSE